MYCSKCGAYVSEGAAFCSSCGQTTGIVASATAPAARGVAMPPPSTGASAAVGYAGFWLRFVAIIIDSILLGIVLVPLFVLNFIGMATKPMPENPLELLAAFGPRFLMIRLIGLLGGWLYFALMESSSWQGTLGKKALGLYVTDMEGRRISFGRASGRFFGKLVSNLTLLIGYIMAGFTARKQALHDMMAGCLVLRRL